MEILTNDLESFFEVPFHVYPKELNYASLFKDDLKRFLSLKNPLFKSEKDFKFYTIIKEKKPVGRILCHIHHDSNERHQENKSFFGLFDCENNKEVAEALLNKAVEFSKSHHCNEVAGCFNLTAMQQCGVVTKIIKNYHYTDQVYGPEYLATLLEECGFEKYFPMTTFELNLEDFDPQTLVGPKQKEIIDQGTIKFERLKRKNLFQMMEHTRIVLNDGFDKNPMFVPLTAEEMHFQAEEMMWIIDQNLSIIAFENERPVGSIICIPDVNDLLIKTKARLNLMTPFHFIKHKFTKDKAVLIFGSVCKDKHNQGLSTVMLKGLLENLKAGGYKRLGITWVADINKSSLRQTEKMGAVPMHKAHLFKKKV